MRFYRPFASMLLMLPCSLLCAQWQLQDAHTTADLRGIDSLGEGVAWASGTNGTVLRTEDSGFVWQLCAIPPGAEHLDIRGVQAFDNNTALVLSSGKGGASRLYKTTDGCQTWRLLLTNPDPDGFWDALRMQPQPKTIRSAPLTYSGVVLGDPVNGRFAEFRSDDNGEHWARQIPGQAGTAEARPGESLFAASNSALVLGPEGGEIFVTGGPSGSRSLLLSESTRHNPQRGWHYIGGELPFPAGVSAGAFSLAIARSGDTGAHVASDDRHTVLYAPKGTLVAVGGDYKKPEAADHTAAWSEDSGLHWTAATTPPHGYRSAVSYDAAHGTWIAVGPNGTDLSADNGHTWHALKPAAGDPPDTDQHWNALSLPFVVGPHGRIGVLRPEALLPASAGPR